MACWFEYNGKRYEPDELVGALKAMTPTEAAKYIPGVKAVAEAPFQKSWHELVLKDAIREAAEKGLDRISWTPGEAQAARYDLSKKISRVNVEKDRHGNYEVTALDHSGHDVINDVFTADKLPDAVGKDLADKIIADAAKGGAKSYDGLDLKVGGEGMKGFYDKMIPDALNKIGKKHGVKVEKGDAGARYSLVDNEGKPGQSFANKAEADRWMAENGDNPYWKLKTESQPVHYMDIPQSLKDEVLQKGFSLFEDSATAGAPLAALESGAKGERIRSAAIRHDGQVYEAPIHGAAYDDAAKATGKSLDKVISKTRPEDSGFVTSAGRFVTRDEAARIAQEAEQVGPIWWYPEKELYSKLGGRDSEAINVDYASAFKDLADKMKGQKDAEKGPVRTAPRGRSADQADDTGGGKVSGGRGEEADGAQVNPALEIARKVRRARGGAVHVGPIKGATGGRADKRPMEVPDGAYVLTADHVSGLGEGNTDAGMKKLSAMFPASKPSALRRAAGGAANVPIYAADGEFVIHPDDIVDRFGELEYGHRALDAWQTAERQELIKTLEQLDPPAQD